MLCITNILYEKMSVKHIATLLLAVLTMASVAEAQEKTTMTREEYITTYAPLAVEQMACFGIPASITLAQGLLESGNGNSELAVNANNHFGIKCSNSWNGPSYRHDDDAPQECFRVYTSVSESYIDHSLILLERKWYQPLFELDMKDYKAWAHGLKKAGYATNPKYAYLLIDIIEKYELNKYDNALLADYTPKQAPAQQEVATAPEQQEQPTAPQEVVAESPTQEVVATAEESPATEVVASAESLPTQEKPVEKEQPAEKEKAAPVKTSTPQKVDIDSYDIAIQHVDGYGIFSQDGRKYIIAKEGDDLKRIAKILGLSERTLRRANNLDKVYTVSVGDKLFIED